MNIYHIVVVVFVVVFYYQGTHYSAETTFFTNFFELTATRSNASVFDSKAWVDPVSSTT